MVGIRTVLIGMSPIFNDIIKQSTAEHVVLDIVGEWETREALEERLRAMAPELILIGLADNEPETIGPMLQALASEAKVIAFSSDRRRAHVYKRRAHAGEIIDLSPASLIGAITG